MDNRTLRILEFNKILEHLSSMAATALAKQKILELRPCAEIALIKKLLRETSEGVGMIISKGNPPLSPVGDIYTISKRVEVGAVLSPRELLDIAHSLSISRKIKKYSGEERRNEDRFPNLDMLILDLKQIKKLEDEIIFKILSEEEMADNASPELNSIRRQIKNSNNKVKDILNDIISSSKYRKILQEAVVTVRGDRYVVPVKLEHKGSIPGIVHDSSASGATIFIEPMSVVEANNRIRELKAMEKEEIEKILIELTAMVEEHLNDINNNYEIITELDVIFAKAKLSLDLNAVEPAINTNRNINIKNARHPLLDKATVVPIDIYLGENFNTLVITGPNTGGKTVTLKTIGLFTLMAQAGLHIPAGDGSELALFNKVFADIGDEQSIEQSLSTFSSHMKNIVNILQEADDNSLALFDELGAGTDPVEGAALAMSILEHLHSIGTVTAATTHYSELKLFALSTPGIENSACEFDVNTLKPTYKLLIGVPGKSNAFAISMRLGLENRIIQRAKAFISQEDSKFEDVITNLEKNRQIIEQEKQSATRYKQEVEKLKIELELQREKLDSQKEKMLNDARVEAKKIIQRAKKESEEMIAELKKIKELENEANMERALEEARKKMKNKLSSIESSIAESALPRRNNYKPAENLKPGDHVEIVDLKKKGTVINKPDDNKEVQVQVGIMKVNIHLSKLRLVKEDKDYSLQSTGAGQIGLSKAASLSTELDLRGQVLDEALMKTDKFLDDAALGGLTLVTIIHGKGTGVLRAGIHEMLKKHRHVKEFRLGRYGEGESGVSVVELR